MSRSLLLPGICRLLFHRSAEPLYQELAKLFLSTAVANSSRFVKSTAINIELRPGPPPQFGKGRDTEVIRFRRGRLWRGLVGREVLWLQAGRATLLADRRRMRLVLFRPGLAGVSRRLLRKSFLPIGLTYLLQKYGLYYLHGAGLTRGRRSLLLIGDGKSGKSTTAYALARRGWRLVADDALLLRCPATGGAVSVSSFYFDLALPHDMIGRFGEFPLSLAARARRAPEGKISLAAWRGRLFQIASGARPSDLVFLSQRGGLPPSPGEALALLLRQNRFALTRYQADHFGHLSALAALVRQCRLHRFSPERQPLSALTKEVRRRQ